MTALGLILALGLGQPLLDEVLDLELDGHTPIPVFVAPGALVRLTGAAELRVWQSFGDRQPVWLELPLAPQPDGAALLRVPPLGSDLLLFDGAAQSLHLTRLDTQGRRRDPASWHALARALARHADDERAALVPPPWADSRLARGLAELDLLGALLAQSGAPRDLRRDLLRRAGARLIAEQGPLEAPVFLRRAVDLGEPAELVAERAPSWRRLAPSPRTPPASAWRRLAPGESLSFVADADGAVELWLRPHPAPAAASAAARCGRARVQIGLAGPRLVTDCPTARGVRLPLHLQAALARNGRVRVDALDGTLLVRLHHATRRPAVSDLCCGSVEAAGAPPLALALARAEELWLQDDPAAGAALAELGRAPAPADVHLWARWRAARLAEDAATALTELAEQAQAQAPVAVAMVESITRDALASSVAEGRVDLVARLARLGPDPRGAMDPARSRSLLAMAGSPDAGVAALLAQHRAEPHRTELARAARALDASNGRWRALELRGPERFGAPVMRDPAAALADGGLVLRAVAASELTIRVPDDPLGLGRLRRIRLVAEALPEPAPWTEITVDGHLVRLPLVERTTTVALYLGPGEHRVAAHPGRVWIETLLDPAADPAALGDALVSLEEMTRVSASPTVSAALPAGAAVVALELLSLGGSAAGEPLELAVCFDQRCQSVGVPGESDLGVAGDNRALRPRRVALEVSPGATELSLTATGAAWVRASVRVRAAPAESPASIALAPLTPAEAVPLFAALAEQLAAAPEEPALLCARGELALRTGDVVAARADLSRAGGDERAAALLRLLGEPGEWRRAGEGETLAIGSAGALIEPGAGDRDRLGPALAALRAHPADESLLAALAAAGTEQAPLATWILAQRRAVSAPVASADALAALAGTQVAARPLLYADAARSRLQSGDARQSARALAEALLAEDAPGALTARALGRDAVAWQNVARPDRSTGTVALERRRVGAVRARRQRFHAATARQPLHLTVLGPTVVRLTARTGLDARTAAGRVELRVGELPLAPLPLPSTRDAEVLLVGMPRTGVSAAGQLLVPVLGAGPQHLVVAPDRGVAWLRLAVASGRSALPDEAAPGVAAGTAPPAEAAPGVAAGTAPPAEAAPGVAAGTAPLAETAPGVAAGPTPSTEAAPGVAAGAATAVGEAPALTLDPALVAVLSPTEPTLPFTTIFTTGVVTVDRESGSTHARAEPFVPLRLELSRRVGQRAWVWGGPQVRLRARAPSTSGASAQLYLGGSPGPRLVLGSAAYLQPLGDTVAWSLRSAADAGWEVPIFSWLRLRSTLGLMLRLQSLDRLPDGARRVDPLVFSLYGRDHPWAPRLRAALVARPLVDLLALANAEVLGNANLGTLDRYLFGASAWWVRAPFYAQLAYDHTRFLPDSDRFLPRSRDRIAARAGVALWGLPGQRVRLELFDRVELQTMRNEASVRLVVELSLGRSMLDVAPAKVPLGSLWAAQEPIPTEVLP